MIFVLFQHRPFGVVSHLSVFNLSELPPAHSRSSRAALEKTFSLLLERNVFNHPHSSTRLNSEPFTANQHKMGNAFIKEMVY